MLSSTCNAVVHWRLLLESVWGLPDFDVTPPEVHLRHPPRSCQYILRPFFRQSCLRRLFYKTRVRSFRCGLFALNRHLCRAVLAPLTRDSRRWHEFYCIYFDILFLNNDFNVIVICLTSYHGLLQTYLFSKYSNVLKSNVVYCNYVSSSPTSESNLRLSLVGEQ